MFYNFRNRILQKRINVRIEHLKHSTCRSDFLKRVKENDLKVKLCPNTSNNAILIRNLLIMSVSIKRVNSHETRILFFATCR